MEATLLKAVAEYGPNYIIALGVVLIGLAVTKILDRHLNTISSTLIKHDAEAQVRAAQFASAMSQVQQQHEKQLKLSDEILFSHRQQRQQVEDAAKMMYDHAKVDRRHEQ